MRVLSRESFNEPREEAVSHNANLSIRPGGGLSVRKFVFLWRGEKGGELEEISVRCRSARERDCDRRERESGIGYVEARSTKGLARVARDKVGKKEKKGKKRKKRRRERKARLFKTTYVQTFLSPGFFLYAHLRGTPVHRVGLSAFLLKRQITKNNRNRDPVSQARGVSRVREKRRASVSYDFFFLFSYKTAI